jgi:hypothetical protein
MAGGTVPTDSIRRSLGADATRLAEDRLTVARYLALRSALAEARAREPDGSDEDRLLGEMDDEWRTLSVFEHAQLRAWLRAAQAPYGGVTYSAQASAAAFQVSVESRHGPEDLIALLQAFITNSAHP